LVLHRNSEGLVGPRALQKSKRSPPLRWPC